MVDSPKFPISGHVKNPQVVFGIYRMVLNSDGDCIFVSYMLLKQTWVNTWYLPGTYKVHAMYMPEYSFIDKKIEKKGK